MKTTNPPTNNEPTLRLLQHAPSDEMTEVLNQIDARILQEYVPEFRQPEVVAWAEKIVPNPADDDDAGMVRRLRLIAGVLHGMEKVDQEDIVAGLMTASIRAKHSRGTEVINVGVVTNDEAMTPRMDRTGDICDAIDEAIERAAELSRAAGPNGLPGKAWRQALSEVGIL